MLHYYCIIYYLAGNVQLRTGNSGFADDGGVLVTRKPSVSQELLQVLLEKYI